MGDVDLAKRNAAWRAVDDCVRSGQVVGVGSGSTAVFVAERLAHRFHQSSRDSAHEAGGEAASELRDIVCVPTSFQSRQLIVQHGLPLSDLERNARIAVTLDGADEIDPALHCIKGGGGAHTQEKIIAYNSDQFVVVADWTKRSQRLGTVWRKGVPIEVVPMAYQPIMRTISALGGAPVLRMALKKAGPVVTDNGGFIVDADFGAIENPAQLESQLRAIPGVVTVGLFVGMAHKAYIGNADGSVTVL